jgi:hypothetical protein
LTESLKFAPKSAKYEAKNKGTARAFHESRNVLWVARRQVAIRSGGGLFSKKSFFLTIKIQTNEN